MKPTLKAYPFILFVLLLAFTALSMASDAGYEAGQIIAKFSPEVQKIAVEKQNGVVSLGIASLDRRMERYRVRRIRQLFPHKHSELGFIYQFDFDPRYDAKAVACDFAEDEHLLYAEPRYRHQPCDTPNDSFYAVGVQWYLDAVQGPDAWDITHGDTSVVIGIVDTGVDWNHPDLADNIWFNSGEDINGDGLFTAIDWNAVDDDTNGFIDDWHGWDFGGVTTSDNNPMENPSLLGSHGTPCAGVASAVTNNDLACAGMSWNCAIMPVKVTRDKSDDIIYGYEGIQYASDNGAEVISLGWVRGDTASAFEQEIIDNAFAKGAILVAAAGTDLPDTNYAPPDSCPLQYPACYNHVTAVAATDLYDKATGWTFYGSWVDVSAPGVAIYNVYWDDTYAMRRGASKSCALVAGVAGLVKSVDPNMTSDEFEMKMRTASDDIDSLNPGYEGLLGGGRLNAYRALLSNRPDAIDDLTIALEDGSRNIAGNIRLTWTEPYDDVGVTRYVVYRSNIATSLGDSLASTIDTTYTDAGAAGDVGTNYFYTVKAVDGDGNKSTESNMVGEYDIGLINGPAISK